MVGGRACLWRALRDVRQFLELLNQSFCFGHEGFFDDLIPTLTPPRAEKFGRSVRTGRAAALSRITCFSRCLALCILQGM